jgi:hypothetical protein
LEEGESERRQRKREEGRKANKKENSLLSLSHPKRTCPVRAPMSETPVIARSTFVGSFPPFSGKYTTPMAGLARPMMKRS